MYLSSRSKQPLLQMPCHSVSIARARSDESGWNSRYARGSEQASITSSFIPHTLSTSVDPRISNFGCRMSTVWANWLRENAYFVSLPVRHLRRYHVPVYWPNLARCLIWRFRVGWEVRMLDSDEGNQGQVAGKQLPNPDRGLLYESVVNQLFSTVVIPD